MFYTPPEDIEFLGNNTICTNGTIARKLVFESAPESETDWLDLWISSGFLAIIVIKFAVANYGLSLMSLADPFVVCAGEFLWIPTDLGMEIQTAEGSKEHVQFLKAFDERGKALPTELLEKWFRSKRRALVHIGLSRTVFWGFIVHLCMFNLFVAVQEEIGEDTSLGMVLQHRDFIVLTVCLCFAALVVTIGWKAIVYLGTLPKPLPKQEGVGGNKAMEDSLPVFQEQQQQEETTDDSSDDGGGKDGEAEDTKNSFNNTVAKRMTYTGEIVNSGPANGYNSRSFQNAKNGRMNRIMDEGCT